MSHNLHKHEPFLKRLALFHLNIKTLGAWAAGPQKKSVSFFLFYAWSMISSAMMLPSSLWMWIKTSVFFFPGINCCSNTSIWVSVVGAPPRFFFRTPQRFRRVSDTRIRCGLMGIVHHPESRFSFRQDHVIVETRPCFIRQNSAWLFFSGVEALHWPFSFENSKAFLWCSLHPLTLFFAY